MSEELVAIQDVVKVSGVSSRALRHYAEIGLLTPSRTGAGGIRLYSQADLLRLQQILLLRELDLGLPEIQRVLDGERDQLTALRSHRRRLSEAAERLDRLQQTVDATIVNLERNRNMSAAEIFDGFDAAKQAEYEVELVDRFGPQAQEHIDQSWARIAEMSKGDADAIAQGFADVEASLTELLKAGADPQDKAVQQQIDLHYAIVCKSWTPSAQAYEGLADLYLSHPDFRARYDAHDPALAEFLAAAMRTYAATTLA